MECNLGIAQDKVEQKLIREHGEVSYRPLRINIDTKGITNQGVVIRHSKHMPKQDDEQFGVLQQSTMV